RREACSPPDDRLLRLLRRRRHPRTGAPRPNRQSLVRPDLRFPPHRWSLQRTDRERPHAHREDPPQRPRIPQHRQLPTTPNRTPRHQMAYSTHRTNTRPPTTVHRVEPHFDEVTVMFADLVGFTESS